MAYSASDVTALEKAIASGARRVRFADGREAEYRSIVEMRDILRLMQAEIAGIASDSSSRSFVAGF